MYGCRTFLSKVFARFGVVRILGLTPSSIMTGDRIQQVYCHVFVELGSHVYFTLRVLKTVKCFLRYLILV